MPDAVVEVVLDLRYRWSGSTVSLIHAPFQGVREVDAQRACFRCENSTI